MDMAKVLFLCQRRRKISAKGTKPNPITIPKRPEIWSLNWSQKEINPKAKSNTHNLPKQSITNKKKIRRKKQD